ncbi:potassium channel family protein [Streptomyces sp. NPDC005551]|uniref:potassium channel family protein n=1 Tax=unclassified Streptomyces TaxID=2593676 RepID=UPI0033EDB588
MKWLVTLAGAGLVMVGLRDVFHTLWHPTRDGGLSRRVMTVFWRLSSRLGRRRAAGLAGPLAMVTVVALWAATVTVGWALIYWPHLPGAFSFATGLEPAEHAGFPDALYISMVTVATLGLGDITPETGWVRVLHPMEAIVGFALLTATVTWVLGIYPALARRRALALRLSHLRRTRPTKRQMDSAAGAAILESLASGVATVSVDFLQYAESYYFHDGDAHTSLANNIRYAEELAELAVTTERDDVRLCGNVLRTALEDLARILEQRFIPPHKPGSVAFAAFIQDHGAQRESD